ncbi:MAG: mandelate racemase/muconate lactonizing enzyme family protein [Rhodospirillales bacterium]|jgi:L-alanine-DL-glutamate epimerase-like enolase superfamily enzyme|nr:mandelate racemase/muconate lactonizing enzyme family protein [Rhodospirillales bacterium]MDP6644486.1 mandelate racemase/muconate lactonizing enzyme family protein [Rhodospirillales bacterium]MDP6840213.1 mandelate racemase/muconate lactonizing enzyme family protein [Rhodospirillales bacterium]
MKIACVDAFPVYLPVKIDVLGLDKTAGLSMCMVRIETDDGHVGWGITGITEEEVIAEAVGKVAAPAITGLDPLATEMIWNKLYWLMSPRGQTGYAAHAIAAIDLALWDIKGKALGQPVWRLLGGARSRVPVYATFGFPFFDREQIGEAAKLWVKNGFTGLKMTVGDGATKRRDEPRPIAEVIKEDRERVRTAREAVGDGIDLYVDGNCNLDPFHAIELARSIEEFGITFFEEPITQNDARQMADMRRRTSIPLACGQNEGLSYRFRELMVAGAVDVVQPNVVITGGFTQCAKIAGMAQAFNVGIDNGGAWPFHNMHLHAGLANGGLVEMHYLAVECCKQVFRGLPEPENGWLALPEKPGLGFDADEDAVRDRVKDGASGGGGKM